MARDYTNLPAMLDALEDELDQEAASIAEMARGAHDRGVSAMGRAREALKAKHAVLDRLLLAMACRRTRLLMSGL